MSLSRDVTRIINDDPWDVTVYHRDPTTNTDTTFTLVGRIVPSGSRWGANISGGGALAAEAMTSRQAWTLLTTWDAGVLRTGDRVVAVHRATSLSQTYRTVFCNRYPYKQEVTLDELR